MILKDTNGESCEIKTQRDLIDFCENKSDFHKIYEMYVDYYGEENVDIKYLETEEIENIDFLNSDIEYKRTILFNIIIYFNTITLKNENLESYTITDLYVKLPVLYNYTCRNVYLTRSSLTFNEYITGYVHSHVYTNPYYSNSDVWSPLCLGTGAFHDAFYRLGPDLNTWEIFCFSLREALEVESLSGVPYIKFSQIGRKGAESYNNYFSVMTNSSLITDDVLKYIIQNYDFKFNVINNVVGIAEFITDFAINISNLYLKYCEVNNISAQLNTYIINTNGLFSRINSSTENTTFGDKYILTFKGNDIKLSMSNIDTSVTYKVLDYKDICYIATVVCNMVNMFFNVSNNFNLELVRIAQDFSEITKYNTNGTIYNL